jgi:pilus assembly protein CpaB
MFLRNLFLTLGVVAILTGAVIAAYLALHVGAGNPGNAPTAGNRPAILVAARPIPAGALLREGDLGWRETEAKVQPAGSLPRGQFSQAQFIGAVARRGLTVGEMVPADALIAPNDQRFLAAVLSPGSRAVTIAVNVAQSASGLVLPDDRVDVILVQDLGDSTASGSAAAKKSVAQILLRDVRVVAVDRAFVRPQTVATTAAGGLATASTQEPRTVTLELNDHDAQRLYVALQVGKVELSLRSLAKSPGEEAAAEAPVWGSDLSPLLLASNTAAAPGPVHRRAVRHAGRAATAEPAAPIIILRGSTAGSK